MAVLAKFSKVKSRRAYKIIQQIGGGRQGGNRKVGGFVMLEKVRAWFAVIIILCFWA